MLRDRIFVRLVAGDHHLADDVVAACCKCNCVHSAWHWTKINGLFCDSVNQDVFLLKYKASDAVVNADGEQFAAWPYHSGSEYAIAWYREDFEFAFARN